MSSTPGSCASGRWRADKGCDHLRQGAVAAELAAHLAGDPFQHFNIEAGGPRRRPAFNRVSGESAMVRDGTGSRLGGRMMHDRLGEQIVELAIVTALRGGGIDLEQRFGFGTAHGLMLDSHAVRIRATRRRLRIERTGKMDAALVVGPSPVITPSRTMVSAKRWSSGRRLQHRDARSDFYKYSDIPRQTSYCLNFFSDPSISMRAQTSG